MYRHTISSIFYSNWAVSRILNCLVVGLSYLMIERYSFLLRFVDRNILVRSVLVLLAR